jgi:hypothetical protein
MAGWTLPNKYVFHQPTDPNREIIVTVMAFDVPTAEHRTK